MDSLKLMALDAEDLGIVSAHVQDAVFKVGDASFSAKSGQFIVSVNRFVWEKADDKAKSFERRRSAIAFKRVKAARSIGINLQDREAVLSLLALNFEPNGEGPDGSIALVLAGGAEIVLDVECIEAQLADLGGAWETTLKPRHSAA